MQPLDLLHNRIDLTNIPFTDRGSRLLLFRQDNSLYIRLAERWVKWESEVGHYRYRPPILSEFVVHDNVGNPLAFEADTYPHFVRLTTALGHFNWVFLDSETLLIQLPPGQYAFSFVISEQEIHSDGRGGAAHGKRNFSYTTNAEIIENCITTIAQGQYRVDLRLQVFQGNALLLNITPRLGFNRSVPEPEHVIAQAEQRWTAWFDAAPPVLDEYREQYYYAWWIMRAGLLSQRYYFTREALTPSKIHYVGVWHWDQFFHAIAYRHIDTHLAEDQIRILIDHQQPNGMLPDAIHDEGLVTHLASPVDADVTKPPLMAWTVLKLFEKSHHLDFLHEVYEPLTRWHHWWMRENVDENGLCHYRHPFSSGLDDSPLWDKGMPVVAPDLNTYLCIQQQSLARIADLVSKPDDAAQFRTGAKQHAQRMLDFLWDGEKHIFNATYCHNPLDVLTPFNLLPMWVGDLPDVVLRQLLKHLTNPNTFWTEWPIPTVAMSDPKFNPMQMWRGPTWVNVNYLFIEALARMGQGNLATQLRRKTLELLLQHRDIYEYYNPLTAERPFKAAPIFGWSAAVMIDLAIQETEAQQH